MMKIRASGVVLALVICHTLSGQVHISNEAGDPHTSAMLEVTSDSRGILAPGLTESQRTGIPSPGAGLMVFQVDNTTGHYFFSGTGWKRFSILNTAENPDGGILFTQGSTVCGNPVQLYRDITSNRLGIGTSSPGQRLSVGGTVESKTQGLKFPDGSQQTTASKACLITFAANNDYNADFLRPFGNVNEEDLPGSGIRTVYPVPLSGRITAVAWRSESADNSTSYIVHHGGSYSALHLTGQNGLLTSLSYAVSAGEYIEVYHYSGTLPEKIILTFYLSE